MRNSCYILPYTHKWTLDQDFFNVSTLSTIIKYITITIKNTFLNSKNSTISVLHDFFFDDFNFTVTHTIISNFA